MGIPLSAGRKREFRASPSATQDAGARQRVPVCRRVVRAVKKVALVLLRALWVGSLDFLLSLLLLLARPARFVFKLGIIGLLLIVVMEGMNHWRDLHFCIIACGAIIVLLLTLGFYVSFIKCLTIQKKQNPLRG
ncbi:hypothetical protein AWB74_06221 [Caballeronia arvi]|uniref:Uncharacterized protein n=1 Tax=Caballeronia arvi TaxID=1777135 RepID=A0A158KNX8_9BURK|nr:hypothetical protein [Caballeronia arvi]SAL82300.1 hypothetical protein AWB74_06221 [Caballeronia arvi]